MSRPTSILYLDEVTFTVADTELLVCGVEFVARPTIILEIDCVYTYVADFYGPDHGDIVPMPMTDFAKFMEEMEAEDLLCSRVLEDYFATPFN